MRLMTTLLPAVLSAALGALFLAHGQSAELRGTVTDAQDRPVPNVNVVLRHAEEGEHGA
jgi:protocatechuate 3,4-dioxygenase beta subunit